MCASVALFPALLGSEWNALSEPVRRMHGSTEQLSARGEADIDGAMNWPARALRRLLALPSPGMRRPIEITIERRGTRETWTRNFAGARMRSMLHRSGNLLCERFGPMAFRFELRRSAEAIDWDLRSTRLLGVPLPRFMSGRVFSQSGSELGRYTFNVDVCMPFFGRLVSYHGWLEIVNG